MVVLLLQIHQRTEIKTSPVRNRHFQYPVRRFLSSERFDRSKKILHRKMGKTQQPSQSSYLLQQVRFAALSHFWSVIWKTLTRCRRNEYFRNRIGNVKWEAAVILVRLLGFPPDNLISKLSGKFQKRIGIVEEDVY